MRKTGIIDGAVCGGVFLLGCFFVVSELFAHRYGATPQAELTVVQGVADSASTSRFDSLEYLHFTVDGQTVEYSSDLPGYSKVLAAVRDGVPLTLGVSTRRETLFPRQGWAPIYTLAIGDETLLTYQDTVTKGYRGSHMTWAIPAVLLCLSSWGFWSSYRNRHRVPMSPEQLAAAWSSPKKIHTAAILFSIIIYAAVMIATLHSDSQNTLRKVFGDAPLGAPLPLFLVIFVTVLFVPVPIAARELYSLIFRWAALNALSSSENYSPALWPGSGDPVGRKISLTIVLCIAAFYIALMVGWIVYANSHGL